MTSIIKFDRKVFLKLVEGMKMETLTDAKFYRGVTDKTDFTDNGIVNVIVTQLMNDQGFCVHKLDIYTNTYDAHFHTTDLLDMISQKKLVKLMRDVSGTLAAVITPNNKSIIAVIKKAAALNQARPLQYGGLVDFFDNLVNNPDILKAPVVLDRPLFGFQDRDSIGNNTDEFPVDTTGKKKLS